MHTVPLGEPSTDPLHPDYVSLLFSPKKSDEKRLVVDAGGQRIVRSSDLYSAHQLVA